MFLGLILCLAAGLLATWLGGLQHVVGGPIIGLFLGIIISNTMPAGVVSATKKGAAFSTKYLLKLGIILAGGTLSFKAVVGVGLSALPLIVFNILLSFGAAIFIGRRIGVNIKTSVLVGGGTAICGGTAIATLTPIVDAKEEDMAYAMTAIFLFDILAALMWPYAARAMGLDAAQYGILGGLAISDTSSVTAAGATFDAIMGAAAETAVGGETITGGAMAVIVKLTRTVMLVAVAFAVAIVSSMKNRGEGAGQGAASVASRAMKAFPVFVLLFLVMAVINTLVNFSGISIGGLALSKLLSRAYKYLIAVALVGVGYKISVKDMFRDGKKPILLGGCTWAAVAASTLVYVLVLM